MNDSELLPLAFERIDAREAFRNIRPTEYNRRTCKVRYWITTGNRRERAQLAKLCAWPMMNWKTEPPPMDGQHRKRNGHSS